MSLNHSYDNYKSFEQRASVESKKAKELAEAMSKVKKQMEDERKAFCVDFAKQLMIYADSCKIVSPGFAARINAFVKQFNQLDKSYQTALNHIGDIPCNALGYLPKKFDEYKKSLKNMEKDPSCKEKIKDIEYERIETYRQSLLHYFNAQMFLHAQALSIYAEAYETLRSMEFVNEFPDANEKVMLNKILKEKNLIQQE